MDYEVQMIELLKENLTDRAFALWSAINQRLPGIWDRLTASTKKYHKKKDGRVPNLAEHTLELLYTAIKLLRMFGASPKTSQADKLLLSVMFHDALKYGSDGRGNRGHTVNAHDKLAGDMVAGNKKTFLEILSEEEFATLEEAVRFHSGRWSTNVLDQSKFDFSDYRPETFFVHILDMMSTADLIKLPGENEKW